MVGLIVLTLNSAAYQTTILIGAIRNLPQGQLEGAHSIGMNPGRPTERSFSHKPYEPHGRHLRMKEFCCLKRVRL